MACFRKGKSSCPWLGWQESPRIVPAAKSPIPATGSVGEHSFSTDDVCLSQRNAGKCCYFRLITGCLYTVIGTT